MSINERKSQNRPPGPARRRKHSIEKRRARRNPSVRRFSDTDERGWGRGLTSGSWCDQVEHGCDDTEHAVEKARAIEAVSSSSFLVAPPFLRRADTHPIYLQTTNDQNQSQFSKLGTRIWRKAEQVGGAETWQMGKTTYRSLKTSIMSSRVRTVLVLVWNSLRIRPARMIMAAEEGEGVVARGAHGPNWVSGTRTK